MLRMRKKRRKKRERKRERRGRKKGEDQKEEEEKEDGREGGGDEGAEDGKRVAGGEERGGREGDTPITRCSSNVVTVHRVDMHALDWLPMTHPLPDRATAIWTDKYS